VVGPTVPLILIQVLCLSQRGRADRIKTGSSPVVAALGPMFSVFQPRWLRGPGSPDFRRDSFSATSKTTRPFSGSTTSTSSPFIAHHDTPHPKSGHHRTNARRLPHRLRLKSKARRSTSQSTLCSFCDLSAATMLTNILGTFGMRWVERYVQRFGIAERVCLTRCHRTATSMGTAIPQATI